MNRLTYCCLAALAISSPALAHGPGAHVHGVARLEVAVDGGTLTLGLESPLDNLLGFEHPPRTPAQKAAVADMAARLNKAAELFAPTPAARCAVEAVKLESPVLEPAPAAAGGGHADLDGEFVFRCAQPAALADLTVKLFEAFPHLRQLDVQLAGPRGQRAAKLTAQAPRLSW